MYQEPLLTIAVPTYNGGRTICNMLDLLLPQCNNQIELLILDNCSTDNTKEIIRKYKLKWGNIKYYRNEENIGPDANFLKCMKMAQGCFTWLVSDDDIVIEGAVEKILKYLTEHKNVGLVYLTTRDFRGDYKSSENCIIHKPEVEEDLYTKNKVEFMKYAGAYWGFMSSYICNTKRFNQIVNPERYYGTYWLQSYIHALCAAGDNTGLGVIKGPCVGAGVYVNIPNFDSALVNGIYYKKMIEFMITEAGFDKKQLEKLYAKRLCHLSRHDILKEKSAGVRKIDKKKLFYCTNKYLEAWLTVYPLYIIPDIFCKRAMMIYRKKINIKESIRTNRPE